MVLEIYGDMLSQPSRAVVLFARANNIDHEAKRVMVGKMEHKTPEFLALNPMGLIPAINDDGFKLFESHAILRYLSAAHSVPDHWYPADPKRRAQVDCILDWHHVNLREGRKLVFTRVFAKNLGREPDETVARLSEKVLRTSLNFIEKNWLPEEGSFLAGAAEPSIADISLVCELSQLELLETSEREAILGPREKIRKWAQATEAYLAPHFAEVHTLLRTTSAKFQAARDAAKRKSAL